MTAEDWDLVRGTSLMAIKGMLVTLEEGQLLDSECLGVVKLVRELPGLEEKDVGLLLDELEL